MRRADRCHIRRSVTPTSLAYTQDPYFIKFWNLPSHYLNAVITAFNCVNVSIIGEKDSVIDGSNCFDEQGEEGFRGPMGISLCRCNNIFLKGYKFVNSANWSHQIDACHNVNISEISIYGGHDGFNVHHCTNVSIQNCDLQTGDDCIAGYDVRNLYVHDCKLNTSCNSFRIGCVNLLVENCQFYGPGNFPHRISGRTNTLYAFEYYSHPADSIQIPSGNWKIKDCTFSGLDSLIHYSFGDEQHLQVLKPLTDVTFENIEVSGWKITSNFNAGKGCPSTLTIKNAKISNSPTESVFLSVDDQAYLILDHVQFVNCASKIIASPAHVSMVNCEGFSLAE